MKTYSFSLDGSVSSASRKKNAMAIGSIITLLMVGAAIEAVPADAQTFSRLGEGAAVLQARLPNGNFAVAPRLSVLGEPLPFPSNPATDLSASRAVPAGPTLTTSLHGRQSFQRAFADLRQEQEEKEKDPVLKYVGVGMMVVGGINLLYQSVSCADGFGGRCVPYVVISAGIGVGGWFLYKRHR